MWRGVQILNLKVKQLFSVQALEALRKLRLEKVAELREFKLRLDHLKTHKDAAQRLRTEVSTGKTRQESLQKQIDELDVEICAQEEVRAGLDIYSTISTLHGYTNSHSQAPSLLWAMHNSCSHFLSLTLFTGFCWCEKYNQVISYTGKGLEPAFVSFLRSRSAPWGAQRKSCVYGFWGSDAV